MKITSFARNSEIQRLRSAVDAALKSVGDEFGVKLTAGSATYDATGRNCTFKLAAAVIDAATGVAADPAAIDFNRYCAMFGMVSSDLGRTFTHAGDRYQITGLKPSAPKYPMLAKNLRTGKGYKWPLDTVINGLRAASLAAVAKAA